MSETALVLAPAIQQTDIALTQSGQLLIDDALSKCALIGKVGNEIENKVAVEAQIELKRVLKVLEDSRIDTVKPALEFQRKVNEFFKAKGEELKSELMRVGVLASDYVTAQEAKRKADEASRMDGLSKLERERQDALSAANSHEERDAIQAHYDERARVESATFVPAPSVKAKGQGVKDDWEILVTDVHTFARLYPNCVNITPKMTEIKALLRAGIKMTEAQGIRATPKLAVGVRLPPTKTIEV